MHRISKAILEDIEQLSELLSLLFAREADFTPDQSKQTAGLREIIQHPDIGCILVMREGDAIVGMVNILYTVSTACGGRVALAEDMIVRPARRDDGLGSLLLSAAIQEARAAGCSRITLLTDRTNDPAIRFYRRHGFVLSEMVPLRLDLQC
jgi:GNAT superfamily N-acetyltransferase